MATDTTCATIILQQLGGNRFKAMTGASNFTDTRGTGKRHRHRTTQPAAPLDPTASRQQRRQHERLQRKGRK